MCTHRCTHDTEHMCRSGETFEVVLHLVLRRSLSSLVLVSSPLPASHPAVGCWPSYRWAPPHLGAFNFHLLFVLCMQCLGWICVCVLCVCLVLRRPEEDSRASETGVNRGTKPRSFARATNALKCWVISSPHIWIFTKKKKQTNKQTPVRTPASLKLSTREAEAWGPWVC